MNICIVSYYLFARHAVPIVNQDVSAFQTLGNQRIIKYTLEQVEGDDFIFMHNGQSVFNLVTRFIFK